MSEQEKAEMSFLDHLEELRWHLFRSIIAVLIFATLAFIFKKIVFDEIIFAPTDKDFFTNRMLNKINIHLNQSDPHFINRKMSGQFMAHIIVSVISGIIIAFPYILYQIWSFVAPALYPKEKRYTKFIFLYSSVLFFFGIFFGYYIIAPLSIDFFLYYETSSKVENTPDLMSYISTVSSTVLASGVMFELPVLIYFLARMGILTPSFIKKYRKHAFVIILIVSAIITPPDMFSQLLVCAPILLLYELSIKIAARVIKKEKLKEQPS